MARQPKDIHKKVKQQEKKVIELTKALEKAQEDYERMLEELKEEETKEIFEAYKKSKRSYEEIIEFLKGKADI